MQAQSIMKATAPAVAIKATRHQQIRVLATRRVTCAAKKESGSETKLNSALVPALTLASVNIFAPVAENLKGLNLPEWLIHWGHPGNMAVVLIAMGGYGAYLGWQIRLSDDADVIEKAKDLHPKLTGGMAVFFALGAVGGLISLTMQGKDVFSSPHFITGMTGLVFLALQAMLPLFFADDPNARGFHAVFGSSIMALFVVHAALGLQLGLSI